MEDEDNDKLFEKDKKYNSWLYWQRTRRRKDKHICSDIPSTKGGANQFDLEDKLMQASMDGCTECLDKLIKAGANVNKTGEYTITALMWASRYGHPDCVNLLLAAGADLYMTDAFGNTALSHAVNRAKSMLRKTDQQRNCMFILLKAIGNNVNSSPLATETPLMSVAAFGDNTWLKSLIAAGADVNRTDMFGRAALMRAMASRYNNDCGKALLEAGADVNVVDKKKWTALKYAASLMNKDGITLLLEAGAEVKDDANSTYINVALRYGVSYTYLLDEVLETFRGIQLLLKIGAYVNQSRDENALEALIDVAFIGGPFLPVQELLLAAGNTIDESNKAIIMENIIKSDEEEFSLKHLSREAVRKQMITAHPHDNLFQAVPKLGIPDTLESYLVYDKSVNDDDYSDAEYLEMWEFLKMDSEDEDSYEQEEEYQDENEDVNETDMVLPTGNNTLVPKKDVAVQTDFSMLLKTILEKLGKEGDGSEVVVKEDGDKRLVVICNKLVVKDGE